MPGDDIIDRLMSVEHEAENLVTEAQNDADQAVRQVEQEERARHEAAVAARVNELTEEAEHRRVDLAEERKRRIAEYRSSLLDRTIDKTALFAALDSILDV